jgi:hypothetical protein
MSNLLKSGAVFALVLGLFAASQAHAATFKSPRGKFSVWMPGTATVQDQQLDGPNGQITQHMFVYEGTDCAYFVSFVDLPQVSLEGFSVLEKLDQAADGGAQAINGEITGRYDIELGDYVGREVDIESTSQGLAAHSHLFLVGNRLYQVMVVRPLGNELDDDMNKFFDSFKLIEN